jgi:hypothetical protein
MKKKTKIKWLDAPEAHDYPAAKSYLNLILGKGNVSEIVLNLKAVGMDSFKVKDIFRASKLSLLGISNSHVKRNCKKIDKGDRLSPLLLVVDSANRTLIIADGYHRMCAVYLYDEDALIPCKIVII